MGRMITYRIQSDALFGDTNCGTAIEITIPSGTFYFVDNDILGRSYRIYETEANIELNRRGWMEVHIVGRVRVNLEYWNSLLNGDSEQNAERRIYTKDELDKAMDLCVRLNKRQKVKVKRLV